MRVAGMFSFMLVFVMITVVVIVTSMTSVSMERYAKNVFDLSSRDANVTPVTCLGDADFA